MHNLTNSRLFHFLDPEKNFTLHFLEGQKLIQDLVLTHSLGRKSFSFFRDGLLTFLPIVAFLKPEEGLGLFIDSEDPRFSLKIESNGSGRFRTLILPAELSEIPEAISGLCRLVKLQPSRKTPYTTVLELKQEPLKDIVNMILRDSYQIPAQVFVSHEADQSLLISKLPDLESTSSLKESNKKIESYFEEKREVFNSFFRLGKNNKEEVQNLFQEAGFHHLGDKTMIFFCPCSRDRMIYNLRSMVNAEAQDLFKEGQKSLKLSCDYCKENYEIFREDLIIKH